MRFRWILILLVALLTLVFLILNIIGYLEVIRFFKVREQKKLTSSEEWLKLHDPSSKSDSEAAETTTHYREILSNDIEEDKEDERGNEKAFWDRIDESSVEDVTPSEELEPSSTVAVATSTTRKSHTWHWTPSASTTTSTTSTIAPSTTTPITTTTQEPSTKTPMWTTTRIHIGSYHREHDGFRLHHEKSTTTTSTTTTTTPAPALPPSPPTDTVPQTTTTRIRVTTQRYQPSSSLSYPPYERISIPSSSSYHTPYARRYETQQSPQETSTTSPTTTTTRRYWIPTEESKDTTTTTIPRRQDLHHHHHHHHRNRTHIDVHAHLRPFPHYPPPYQLPNVIFPTAPPTTTTTEEPVVETTTQSHHHHHQHHHHHNNQNHSHIQYVHLHHHHHNISTTETPLPSTSLETTTRATSTSTTQDKMDFEIEAIGDIVPSTDPPPPPPRQRQRQPEPKPKQDLKSEERQATLVTGFLDIGRGEWDQYRRPLSKYHEFMENLLSLDNYLVVFTDNTTSEFVRKFRKNLGLMDKTLVHEISLQDLPLYGYINEARRIIDDELKNVTFYTHVGDRDMRTHPEAISAEYNIVVNSKTHFLHNVTMANPFSTEHFIWLDAGYGHGNANYFPYNYQWRPKFPDGKISLIKVTPDYDVLSTYNLQKLYRKNWAVLSGGFIAGDKHSIGQLHSIVHRKFIQLIYQNYVDDDQTLLVLAVNSHPHLFHIIQGDWFDAFRLFSVDPEVQLG